jgi:quercetin dioxygenase-like cupin family protein
MIEKLAETNMTDEQQVNKPSRRIITGHSSSKQARVMRDETCPNVRTRHLSSSTTIWSTPSVPAPIDIDGAGPDRGAEGIASGVPANGTRFMIMDLQAGADGKMHRTDTLDYVICLEGEIEMRLDEGTVTLKPGDALVQQATNHAWANRTDRHARLAIVLIDSVKLGPGFPEGRR